MTRRELGLAVLASLVPEPEAASWIITDRDGLVLSSNYDNADVAASPGSLLKPFLAAAYLRSGKVAPVVECRANGACWKTGGHGRLDLTEALAHSCNVYFMVLARLVDRAMLDSVCLSYGLARPGREWKAERLIGLTEGWPQTPRAVAGAFARLARDSNDASVRPVLSGMALCAYRGTAKESGFACYAKTGTAPCSHMRRAQPRAAAGGGDGDGYAVAMYPLAQPRRVLLVMQHGTTGARAARAFRSIAVRVA